MAPLSFKFGTGSLRGLEAVGGAADPSGLIVNPNDVDESSLKRLGVNFSSNELPDDYLFSRMGGWNVTFRSSVVRITGMKLFGTGMAAAFLANSPYVGQYTAWSCALSAAVNFIACAHYYAIWHVRRQTFGGAKYDQWMAKVGRAPAENEGLVEKEQEHDARVVFYQEVVADGWRHSDFLMTLDLGHLREYLFLASNGVVPELTIAKEWLAAYQSILIFFGTVWRFYTNEGRSTRDGRGGHTRPMFITIILAWGSFAASCGLFVLICWTLLDGLPSAEAQAAASFPEHLSSDIICLQVLVLVWCGYPVLSMLSRLSHWGVDGDKYSATWSVIKDVGFAFLDVTSKGGLAIFFVLKASWVDAATENALVAAGKAHLNLTVG